MLTRQWWRSMRRWRPTVPNLFRPIPKLNIIIASPSKIWAKAQSLVMIVLHLLRICWNVWVSVVRIQGKYEEARGFFEKALKAAYINILQHALLIFLSKRRRFRPCSGVRLRWTWYDTGNNVKAREYYGHAEQVLVETGCVIRYCMGDYSSSSKLCFLA